MILECMMSPKVVLHLNYKDVNLGYFEFVQHRIKDMFCGQLLKVSSEGYL